MGWAGLGWVGSSYENWRPVTPVLSQVVRRVLAIWASSAQSGREFSSVGHTLTDPRTRLSANKVEAVELLRCGLQAGMQAHVYWRCSVTVDGYEWCMLLPSFAVFLMVRYNVISLILVDIYTVYLIILSLWVGLRWVHLLLGWVKNTDPCPSLVQPIKMTKFYRELGRRVSQCFLTWT